MERRLTRAAPAGETGQREKDSTSTALPLVSWVILNRRALRMKRHEIVLDCTLPDWTDHGRPRRERR